MTEENDNKAPYDVTLDSVGHLMQLVEMNADTIMKQLDELGTRLGSPQTEENRELVRLIDTRVKGLRYLLLRQHGCSHFNLEVDYIWQANKGQTVQYRIEDFGQRLYEVEGKGIERTNSTESFEQWTVTCKDCGKVIMDQQGPDRTLWGDLDDDWKKLLEVLSESFGEDREGGLLE